MKSNPPLHRLHVLSATRRAAILAFLADEGIATCATIAADLKIKPRIAHGTLTILLNKGLISREQSPDHSTCVCYRYSYPYS